MITIMKAKYLKPTSEFAQFDIDDVMITASVEGETILGDGGDASSSGVTSADSRRGSVWDDDED